jgi:hypothetical protein
MTKDELAILRGSIKAVAHYNPNEWWELKREIYDSGYQSFYQSQLFFDRRAQVAVNALPDNQQAALVTLWRNDRPGKTELDDGAILFAYGRMIVEVIIERAGKAAYRTENW